MSVLWFVYFVPSFCICCYLVQFRSAIYVFCVCGLICFKIYLFLHFNYRVHLGPENLVRIEFDPVIFDSLTVLKFCPSSSKFLKSAWILVIWYIRFILYYLQQMLGPWPLFSLPTSSVCKNLLKCLNLECLKSGSVDNLKKLKVLLCFKSSDKRMNLGRSCN